MHLARANTRNQIRHNGIEYDIASWYSWLTSGTGDEFLTFPSISIPLPPEAANSILHQHYSHHAKRKRDYTPATIQQDLTVLSSLEQSIRQVLNTPLSAPTSHSTAESPQNNQTGWFIRLFSRSPKDGISVYGGEQAIGIYQHLLSLTKTAYSTESLFWSSGFNLSPSSMPKDAQLNLHHKHKKTETPQATDLEILHQYNALALTDWCLLRIFNAKEALQLLYSSERARYDLTLDLERYEKLNEKWDNGIMLRRWDDRIRPDLEFRCFVNNKTITAISQYDPIGYFPHVVFHRKAIQEAIFNFFQAVIKTKVPLESYVIDLAVIPSNASESNGGTGIVVIELNPFDQWTSGALFDWTTDKEVLHGNSPFEFRLHEELHEKFRSVTIKLVEKYIMDNTKIAKEKLHHSQSLKEPKANDTTNEEDIGDSFLNLEES